MESANLCNAKKYVDKLWIRESYEVRQALIQRKLGKTCKIYFLCYSVRMSFTYNPKKRKRSKSHGFRVRSKTPGGRKVLAKRRAKGRKRIAVK